MRPEELLTPEGILRVVVGGLTHARRVSERRQGRRDAARAEIVNASPFEVAQGVVKATALNKGEDAHRTRELDSLVLTRARVWMRAPSRTRQHVNAFLSTVNGALDTHDRPAALRVHRNRLVRIWQDSHSLR